MRLNVGISYHFGLLVGVLSVGSAFAAAVAAFGLLRALPFSDRGRCLPGVAVDAFAAIGLADS